MIASAARAADHAVASAQQMASDAKREAQKIASDAKHDTQKLASDAKHEIQKLASDAKQQVQQLAFDAKQKAANLAPTAEREVRRTDDVNGGDHSDRGRNGTPSRVDSGSGRGGSTHDEHADAGACRSQSHLYEFHYHDVQLASGACLI